MIGWTRTPPRMADPLVRRQARYALSGPVPGASPVVCHPSDRAPFPPHPPPPLVTALFGRLIGTTRLVRPLACSTAASAPRLPATARDRCARLRASARSPRFRRCLFARDGVFDLGGATASRITTPHMLPSTFSNASAPAIFLLSRLNSPPHVIVVYASHPPWPTTAQHSLPGVRYDLPGPDFHRLDNASLPGAQRIQGIPRISDPPPTGFSRSPDAPLRRPEEIQMSHPGGPFAAADWAISAAAPLGVLFGRPASRRASVTRTVNNSVVMV